MIIRQLFFWSALIVPLFACADVSNKESVTTIKEEISASEDLMREHGILNRLLLIYQEIARRIEDQQTFPIDTLQKAAQLVRNFLEDYHEKLEEEYIFPRFEQANQLVDLVKTLKEQHQVGRELTNYILSHANEDSLKQSNQRADLSQFLHLYIRMFRPHEAREDTVLFPAFRKLISRKEYASLGDKFEDREHQLFGSDGFENIVSCVADIEQQLGIYNLSTFTPELKK
jgi:hemerythrin-like domain-containing protein